MKNFLFNFKTKPTLFTLFIIIGFLCAIPYAIIDKGMGAHLYAFLITPLLIPVFIIYRYFIKRFKTKHIFITESVLTVLFSIWMLVVYLAGYRHLVIDLTNYSENYYLIISGPGEYPESDTRRSTFLINDEAVLHEQYFVLNQKDMSNVEIKYPENWQQTDYSRTQQGRSPGQMIPIIQFDTFRVELYYDDTFDLNSRTLDSLSTLVVYAWQHDISVSEANTELTNVWAEMNYMYTTSLEPYVQNSKAHIPYRGRESDNSDTLQMDYEKWQNQNEKALPADNGIYLSYTSYERIMKDLKRRAEQSNWSEKTMNKLIEYYSARMPYGFFRLYIERPTEDLANLNRFYIAEAGVLPNNPALPPNGSGSTLWTNTRIFRKNAEPDSTFQVIVDESFDSDLYNSSSYRGDSFTFDLRRN